MSDSFPDPRNEVVNIGVQPWLERFGTSVAPQLDSYNFIRTLQVPEERRAQIPLTLAVLGVEVACEKDGLRYHNYW